MALTAAAFTTALLEEARQTHPWLHHPLFHMIWDGKLSRAQLQSVIRQQGCFFLDTLATRRGKSSRSAATRRRTRTSSASAR